MITIDLHTHSIISPDGAITKEQYEMLLAKGILDCVAITDHNETAFARTLQKELGDKIIVGEEITTRDGEMIGLFLQKTIPAGLTVQQTVDSIHEQGGLVYIPHPFETIRKGIQLPELEKIVHEIDIIEVFNGRGKWRGKATEAESFAKKHHLVTAASSDAHGVYGIGKTYSVIAEMPTHVTLRKLLATGQVHKVYAPLWTFLYPAMNKVKKKLW